MKTKLLLLCAVLPQLKRNMMLNTSFLITSVFLKSDDYKQKNGYYGNNCKYFVRYVCSQEGRGYLPSINQYDDRTLTGLTPIGRGDAQRLNDDEGKGKPTSTDIKNVFKNDFSRRTMSFKCIEAAVHSKQNTRP